MGAKNRVMSDAVNLLIEKFNNSEKDDKRNLLKQLSSISDIRVVEPILKASIDESNPSFAYFAKKSLRIVRKNLKDQNIDIDSHLKKLLLKREWDALDSENYKRRVKAVQNLSKGKNEKVFKRLVEMLKTETHLHVLATLVKAVARTGGSRALGHLKKYLENEDERLRANTIEALEIIEVREAFEIIKLYLKDPQRRVKVNVAKALWHYSKLEALEQFSIMLKSEVKEDKISAIFSLSSIISLDARKLLQLMLNDIDIEIRLQASVAVSKLDEKLNKLINEGKTGNEVKVYKTMAIGESLDQSKEEVDGFNTLFEKITKADNYQEKINILQELAKVTAQEGNFTKLLEWVKKNDNRFVLATAAKTLAHFNSSGKFNDEYFKYCSEVLLKNPDERVRANTVEALQSFASKEVFEIILPFLNDKSNRVKANSIKLLWSFDRKRSSDQIVKMIKSRDHFQIESVTFILNQLKGEDAEKLRNLLISQAKDDDMKVNVKLEYTTQIKKDQTEKTKEDVFSEFLDNLSGVEEISNEVIEKNMSLLESGTRDEKIKSSRILGSLGSKAILSFLTELMDKEKDEYVVASLAKTIGQVGGEDAISSLANIIKHPDSRVRANVIEGFGYIDSDKICKFMEIALYDSDNRVQANAINVLWERDQKKAIDRINKMIFSSEPWVRRSAIYVLGQIQNEESIKLLRELLNDQDIDVAIYASENL
ncbi:HEAT repeat domain-containing protein, partial [bacterium]|nr:HEAT repeat domain-containing protein [bacterium]